MNELRYLLDANIVSDMIRNPTGRVFDKIEKVGGHSVCTTVIVACEMRFGLAKSRSKRLEPSLLAVFESLPVLPLERDVDVHYGRIRAELETAGRGIGANDLLIAAHALSLDLVLVTHNRREFDRVPGLKVEDWLV